jgi:NADP-dependent alcohol dehydrogenase
MAMHNFAFQNGVKVLFGRGQIAALADEVPVGARVMATFGGGSAERSGVLAQVRAALGDRLVAIFGGIEANPDVSTLVKAVDEARAKNVDFLVAVGGGSVIDGTKWIAAAVPFEGDPWTMLSEGAPVRRALPLGAVLTLPATGSEMNGFAVVSRRATGDKLGMGSPLLYPRFAVCDPEASFSLPPRQIANGVVDAFVHVVEQYMTYPAAAPLQDRMAEGILQTLIEEGPKTLADPHDYDARANLFWCATQALNGLIGVGVPQDWSTHQIGHELTALYGLDHAQSLAVVLPANWQVRREAKREKLVQYARRVWGLAVGEDEAIDQAIDKTRDFFESLGVPTMMAGYRVAWKAEDVVAQLIRHGRVALGEKGDVTPDVVRAILALAA